MDHRLGEARRRAWRWCRRGALALAALLSMGGPAVAAGTAPVPQRLYVFGDSYSDIGAGYVDGNGPTAVFYMARALGIELTYPGSATAAPASSLDFAVSGAKSDDAPGRQVKANILGRGFRYQARQFADLARGGAVTFEPGSTIAFIAIGINDGKMATRQTVANMTDAIATLYEAGLRRFVIADLPARLPISSATAARLNPAFAALRTTLGRQYPDARFARSRWGAFYDEVLAAPAAHGIANATDPCAPGRALFDQDTTSCATPDAYFYYHPSHPSTAVHRMVGERLAAEMRRGS